MYRNKWPQFVFFWYIEKLLLHVKIHTNIFSSSIEEQEDICAKVSIDDYNLPPCNTAVDCGSQSKICCDGSCVQAFCTDGASYNLSLYETYSTGGAYGCTIR